MSMELYVISPKRLDTIQEWQKAINEFQFPIRLSEDVDFEKTSGFLPVLLNGKLSGFECDHWTIDDIKESLSFHHIALDPNLKHVLAFRWGGNFDELICATQASTAYALATGGLIFDPQEGEMLSNEKSLELAKNVEKEVEFLRSLP
jgi:hypothetical protein